MALSKFKCVNLYPSFLIKSRHLLFGLTPRSSAHSFTRVKVLGTICSRDMSTNPNTNTMSVPVSVAAVVRKREMGKLGERNTKRFLSGNVNPGQRKEQEKKEEDSGARETTKPKPESESESGESHDQKTTTTAVSKKSRLKQAVKEYGSTVIVFHIAMSLTSLGFCYLLISSGLDLPAIVQKIGFGESILKSSITQGASTFVIAYAVHKVFAPLRITITLTATPLIVRKLRTMGILKKPVP